METSAKIHSAHTLNSTKSIIYDILLSNGSGGDLILHEELFCTQYLPKHIPRNQKEPKGILLSYVLRCLNWIPA